MIRYSLSIAGNWQNTFRKWASELRAKTPLESSDFDLTNNQFEPTVTAGGSMTIANASRRFNYDVKGKMCFVSMYLLFTTGGVANNNIYITLPFPGRETWQQAMGLFIGGTNLNGWGYIGSGEARMTVGRYDNANFTLAAQGVAGNFFYEIN